MMGLEEGVELGIRLVLHGRGMDGHVSARWHGWWHAGMLSMMTYMFRVCGAVVSVGNRY